MKMLSFLLLSFVLLVISSARADQIEMQNGDRYMGKVLAMTNSALVLESEILGTLSVPRDKVSRILLGTAALNNATQKPAAPPAGRGPAKPILGRPALPGITNLQVAASPEDPNEQKKLIEQVQDEFLAGADPAAKSKYNEMVNSFLAGKLNLSDIRAQAAAAASQLRAARKDLGDDAGFALDGYLAILDSFLKDSASSEDARLKVAPAPKSKGEAQE